MIREDEFKAIPPKANGTKFEKNILFGLLSWPWTFFYTSIISFLFFLSSKVNSPKALQLFFFNGRSACSGTKFVVLRWTSYISYLLLVRVTTSTGMDIILDCTDYGDQNLLFSK